MITKEEALVEMRVNIEPALKEISAISQKVDRDSDRFSEVIGFDGAYKGLKEALWLIDFEMDLVKAEASDKIG